MGSRRPHQLTDVLDGRLALEALGILELAHAGESYTQARTGRRLLARWLVHGDQLRELVDAGLGRG